MTSRLGLPVELEKQRAALRQPDGSSVALSEQTFDPAGPGWYGPHRFAAIITSYLFIAFIHEKCRQRRSTVAPQGQLQPHTQELLPGSGKPAKPASKPRYGEWDFMKLVMQVLVVANHTDMMLCGNPSWEYPGIMIQHWPCVFKMNTLVFISGVFGSNIERGSMCKMLCYTLGTMTLFGTANHFIFHQKIWLGWYFWYMWVIFTCRALVSPAFAWCRQQSVPVVVPLIATILICYMMMHFEYESWSSEALCFALSFVREANFFSPYFALGLCFPLKKWHALMQDTRVAVLCATFLVLWWGSLFHSRQFREWADGACTLPEQCTSSIHYPDSVYPPLEMGWITLSDWVRVFCQRAAVGCAVLCVLGKSVQPLSYVLPMDSICALGSRTVYSYELHLFVMFWLAAVYQVGSAFKTIPDQWWPLACITYSATTVVALSSSLTERLFKWLVLPYWMLDVPGIPVKLWSKALAVGQGGRAVA